MNLVLQARGVLVGGSGALRADGRSQFGCRQLVSKLNAPLVSHQNAFPVAFWEGSEHEAHDILHEMLETGEL